MDPLHMQFSDSTKSAEENAIATAYPESGTAAQPTPILTITALALSIGLTFVFWTPGGNTFSDKLFELTFPYSYDIWSGRLWQLVTAVFYHGDLVHIVCNAYWFWRFGTRIESELGRRFWIVLFLSAAVISSSAELGASGEMGIGISGVVCAFFGFIWVCRERYPSFINALTPRLVSIFITFLGLCFVLTWVGVWNIGNAAHFSGLLFGCSFGAVFVLKWRLNVSIPAFVALCVVSLVPLIWCPWSGNWLGRQGYLAMQRGDYVEAEALLSRSVRFKDLDAGWRLYNLGVTYAELGKTEEFWETHELLKQADPNMAAELIETLDWEDDRNPSALEGDSES